MDSTRRTALAGLAGLAAAVALPVKGAVAAARAPWARTDPVPGQHILVSGGVLRLDESEGWVSKGTPYLHRNGAHGAPGIKSVEISPHGAIRIHQTVTDPAKNPIIGAFAQADETLGGRMGIIAGATRGTGSTDFYLYDTRIGRQLDFRNKSDRQRVESKVANLWVTFLHINAASWGNGN